MSRSYENALELLESRRRNGRPKALAVSPEMVPSGNIHSYGRRGRCSLTGMKEWLDILGHTKNHINQLNVIHVAGTKGKGSTCAFTRCILRAHGLRTGFPKRIGLYTSPHLRCVRERIQINDQPITEELFTKYFFEVWETLNLSRSELDSRIGFKPRYLQLLALVAFHTFIKEGVEAAIFETHHGGEFDSTNVTEKPIVSGITSLGLDHVAQLGPTLEDIAWHKAGVLKSDCLGFSVQQSQSTMAVIQERAKDKRAILKFIKVDDSLLPDRADILGVPVQRLNFSLALELSRSFLELKAPGNPLIDDDIQLGLESFAWPGRFQILEEISTRWFVDGAHNELSVGHAAKWYATNTTLRCPRGHRALIFTHFSTERDGEDLLRCLARTLFATSAAPEHVILTTYQERASNMTKSDALLKTGKTPVKDILASYSALWKQLNTDEPCAKISTTETIEEAIHLARVVGSADDKNQVLITGSLYLVGGALNILQS